jgi:hypothetical protein
VGNALFASPTNTLITNIPFEPTKIRTAARIGFSAGEFAGTGESAEKGETNAENW